MEKYSRGRILKPDFLVWWREKTYEVQNMKVWKSIMFRHNFNDPKYKMQEIKITKF